VLNWLVAAAFPHRGTATLLPRRQAASFTIAEELCAHSFGLTNARTLEDRCWPDHDGILRTGNFAAWREPA